MPANALRVPIRGYPADVRRFANLERLSHAAAAYVLAAAETTLETRDRFSLVLTGGSSPLRLYELFADVYRTRLPWDRIHLFWSDERYVPRGNPESNQGAAYDAFIGQVPIPAEQVHALPTKIAPPAQAAEVYEETLQRFFGGPPAFDLALLGLGEDGHVASLFPHHHPERQLEQPDASSWVEVTEAPPDQEPRQRLSLTLPALNRARRVLFLVHGARKREAVRAVLRTPDSTLPAAYVHPQDELAWYVDAAAWGEE
jgi:6-phosphogluconolactonase